MKWLDFYISANPGEDFKPWSRLHQGNESCLMLKARLNLPLFTKKARLVLFGMRCWSFRSLHKLLLGEDSQDCRDGGLFLGYFHCHSAIEIADIGLVEKMVMSIQRFRDCSSFDG